MYLKNKKYASAPVKIIIEAVKNTAESGWPPEINNGIDKK